MPEHDDDRGLVRTMTTVNLSSDLEKLDLENVEKKKKMRLLGGAPFFLPFASKFWRLGPIMTKVKRVRKDEERSLQNKKKTKKENPLYL